MTYAIIKKWIQATLLKMPVTCTNKWVFRPFPNRGFPPINPFFCKYTFLSTSISNVCLGVSTG